MSSKERRYGGERGLAEAGSVAAGWSAELPAILAAELRGAVVARAVADARDIVGVGGEEERRPCRRICFWNWIGLFAVTAWKLR
jgi:hypothetical protein